MEMIAHDAVPVDFGEIDPGKSLYQFYQVIPLKRGEMGLDRGPGNDMINPVPDHQVQPRDSGHKSLLCWFLKRFRKDKQINTTGSHIYSAVHNTRYIKNFT